MKLAGRSAIITGASLGLGAEIAEQFAAAGAGLMLCARNQAELEAQRARLTAAHPSARIPPPAGAMRTAPAPSWLAASALPFPDGR